jgi:large subunit ribosomal protein L29
MTKANDLREKSADDLKKAVLDLRKEKMNLRFQQAGLQLQKTSELRRVRRDIARAKTVLGEKQNAQG